MVVFNLSFLFTLRFKIVVVVAFFSTVLRIFKSVYDPFRIHDLGVGKLTEGTTDRQNPLKT